MLLIVETSEATKTMQAIIIPLGCPPELDHKSLLLKMPHIVCKTWRNQGGHELEASSL